MNIFDKHFLYLVRSYYYFYDDIVHLPVNKFKDFLYHDSILSENLINNLTDTNYLYNSQESDQTHDTTKNLTKLFQFDIDISNKSINNLHINIPETKNNNINITDQYIADDSSNFFPLIDIKKLIFTNYNNQGSQSDNIDSRHISDIDSLQYVLTKFDSIIKTKPENNKEKIMRLKIINISNFIKKEMKKNIKQYGGGYINFDTIFKQINEEVNEKVKFNLSLSELKYNKFIL